MMEKTCKIVPAILTEDPKALDLMIHQAEEFTTYAQIDIMDGQFVPSQSITGEHLIGLTTKLSWEAHLMIEHPERYLEDFKRAGAQKIVFHFEATTSPQEVISLTKKLGMTAGLAINPETPISAINSIVHEVDSVLFLTVNPGFYGSQFLPEVMDKVAEFRSTVPGIYTGVDGGIKESNVTQIAGYGVDYIFVGSAIFLQPNPGDSFRHLQELANEGYRRRKG
jgi:ribulose-phosphate 3-epimerase